MRCDAICARADWRGPAALDNELVIEVEPGRFEDMVVAALDGLPEERASAAGRMTPWPGSDASVRCNPWRRSPAATGKSWSGPDTSHSGSEFRPPAVPAGTGSSGDMPVRSRCGAACGSGCETALALGDGFGLRGSRAPAPPPRPR